MHGIVSLHSPLCMAHIVSIPLSLLSHVWKFRTDSYSAENVGTLECHLIPPREQQVLLHIKRSYREEDMNTFGTTFIVLVCSIITTKIPCIYLKKSNWDFFFLFIQFLDFSDYM